MTAWEEANLKDFKHDTAILTIPQLEQRYRVNHLTVINLCKKHHLVPKKVIEYNVGSTFKHRISKPYAPDMLELVYNVRPKKW